jgi:acetylornithine deacetylase/succinyl-diaminopimelate desuccinylase-like protein
LIDDYLSEFRNLTRNPTRSGSKAVYFTGSGLGKRSTIYLLKVHAACPHSPFTTKGTTALGEEVPEYLVAEQLVSAAFAMRMISANVKRKSPLGTSLILFGNTGERDEHEYLNVRSLKEAIMCNENSTPQGNHVIIIEPTGLRVCNVQKGCLIFKLVVKASPHNPALTWLGESTWDSLARFQKSANDLMEPRHAIYPVEYGRAPPAITSNFLIGYPTISTSLVRSDPKSTEVDRSIIESSHYVSLPPEFSYRELMTRLIAVAERVGKTGGCQLSIDETYVEEPFREDPNSPLLEAISNAVLKTSGFEPVFEWLPFPVSARELKGSGFARDVVVFGPGDWAPAAIPNEKEIVTEILQASKILVDIPNELAHLEGRHQADKNR